MSLLKSKNPNTEMHFLDHLEALRWHLVRAAIAIVVFALVAFLNTEILFDQIILGAKSPDFLTYRVLCQLSDRFNVDMCIREVPFILINIDISGQFTTHIYTSFIAGFILGFPYLIWELWRFIKPALSKKELNYSRGIVFFSSLLFLSGVLFGYYIISPLSINFLGSYQISSMVANQITLSSFISTVTMLTLSSGVVFELPVVIYFLSKIGIVTPSFLRTYRRHAMVIILIIAALITPSPDISSQILVAIPLFILYEIGIGVSAMVLRNKEKEAKSQS
ncbi:MAG: twin-arginine translocase subunit TatC [Bacteroidetes bacterium]|nr:twin-arginine translocase subunit TatC [Bacteroidota bacterium]MBK7388791.1 twin-arginine translocase subunit TatC [Bacteroidota bacterium]MBK7968392.1 twin-arginine translocase subunit TatC [Bacteroidota bacterium]MBK8414000.1 twin-arginine translocase subunit TatC [Bacteroidota bacterium]MBK8873426.1 twin-arginine translocase subunit TatC [Bacteroidota bacterium]